MIANNDSDRLEVFYCKFACQTHQTVHVFHIGISTNNDRFFTQFYNLTTLYCNVIRLWWTGDLIGRTRLTFDLFVRTRTRMSDRLLWLPRFTNAIGNVLLQGVSNMIHSENNLFRILDHNVTRHIYIHPERVIISEYSEFYPISFGYLHPEIQSLQKWIEKHSGPIYFIHTSF